MNFSSHFYAFGLIGYPLGHSLSPQIHGAALHALGISGEYSLYPIPPLPGGQAKLAALLSSVRGGAIQGLNITIPHKQNIAPYLDELTPAAQTIGAVNTIYWRDGALIGDNTDAPGFWGDLQPLINSNDMLTEDHQASALILGSGGSARAVAYALLTHGYQITINARYQSKAKAENLKKDLSILSNQIDIICLETEDESLNTDQFSLLVNCTPVGMHPHEDDSPWPENIDLPQNAAVYDLVYNPRETRLIHQARAQGLPTITGLGMLVEQAALAFERWTGLEAPRQVMREAVNF